MNKYYIVFEAEGNNPQQIEQLAKEIEGNTSMECFSIVSDKDYHSLEMITDIRKVAHDGK